MLDIDKTKEQLIDEVKDLRKRIISLEAKQDRAEKELKQCLDKLHTAQGDTINVVSSVIELRDQYTAGHQQMVSIIACAIAHEMGLSNNRIEEIRIASLLHDIGKLHVPTEILDKPSRLTPAEFAIIHDHPKWGYKALLKLGIPEDIARIVLQHHERMDGSGYPSGLRGYEIILEARILGVAEVVEAMAASRPQRQAPGLNRALNEITKNKGTLYDPQVVDACIKVFTEKGLKLQ